MVVLYSFNITYFFIKVLNMKLPTIFQSISCETHSKISTIIELNKYFIYFNRKQISVIAFIGYLQTFDSKL